MGLLCLVSILDIKMQLNTQSFWQLQKCPSFIKIYIMELKKSLTTWLYGIPTIEELAFSSSWEVWFINNDLHGGKHGNILAQILKTNGTTSHYQKLVSFLIDEFSQSSIDESQSSLLILILPNLSLFFILFIHHGCVYFNI